MKLLTDFDGVWTLPEAEGVAHGAELDEALLALAGERDRDATRAWIAAARHTVRPEAADAGRALLAAGVEVVVVSNSGTDKLRRWFAHARVPASLHPERVAGALRLRGAARKFVLAPGAPVPLVVGSLRVDVARPDYARVLAEEAPDAVVGDVFSLDLALPLAIKRRDPAWRGVRLFWLVHPYTPERMRREIAQLPAGERGSEREGKGEG